MNLWDTVTGKLSSLWKTTFGAAHVMSASLVVDSGGGSESVSISGTSAQSSAITAGQVIVSVDTDCFVRQGADPTALDDGTDMFLFADSTYRLVGITSGNKLAFITTGGSGNAYITPGA